MPGRFDQLRHQLHLHGQVPSPPGHWPGTYEFILTISDDGSARRAKALQMYAHDETIVLVCECQFGNDDEETQRLWRRLRIYASPEIRAKYRTYVQADQMADCPHQLVYSANV